MMFDNRASCIPTHNDVLLGRGVSTNRHPGNENFRRIVSQHVDVYVTSTKKEKMMISRSIVQKVNTELNPPGRFLEKCHETDLWHEVDNKRALEKTSQALRDGAAPLRKKNVSDDISSLAFLDAIFDDELSSGPNKLFSSPGSKKHRRTNTAPAVPAVLASDNTNKFQKNKKKQRSNPDIAGDIPSDPDEMDRFLMEGLRSLSQQQQSQQAEQLAQTMTFPKFTTAQQQQAPSEHLPQQAAAAAIPPSILASTGASQGSNNRNIFNMPQPQQVNNSSLTDIFLNSLQFDQSTATSMVHQVPQQEQQQSRRVSNEGQSVGASHGNIGFNFPSKPDPQEIEPSAAATMNNLIEPYHQSRRITSEGQSVGGSLGNSGFSFPSKPDPQEIEPSTAATMNNILRAFGKPLSTSQLSSPPNQQYQPTQVPLTNNLEYVKRSSSVATSDASMGKMSTSSNTQPTTESCHSSDVAAATATATAAVDSFIKDKDKVDMEEFAREMGPDELFFGLCHSDPIDGFGEDDDDDDIFDQEEER